MRGTDAQLILGHTIFMAGKTQSLLSHGNLSFRCVWDEHHDTYLIEKEISAHGFGQMNVLSGRTFWLMLKLHLSIMTSTLHKYLRFSS